MAFVLVIGDDRAVIKMNTGKTGKQESLCSRTSQAHRKCAQLSLHPVTSYPLTRTSTTTTEASFTTRKSWSVRRCGWHTMGIPASADTSPSGKYRRWESHYPPRIIQAVAE